MAFPRPNVNKRDRLSSSGSALSEDSDILEFIDDESMTSADDSETLMMTPINVEDPRLIRAASTAVKENQMMPLIKEELRYTILSRRSKLGMGDIVFEEKKRPVKKVMNEQEMERYLRRQEQNRRAATKCRKKKKQAEVTLLEAYQAEKDKYAVLLEQLESLKKEKLKLEESLRDHVERCHCILNPVSISPSTFVPQESQSSTTECLSTATEYLKWNPVDHTSFSMENTDPKVYSQNELDIPENYNYQDLCAVQQDQHHNLDIEQTTLQHSHLVGVATGTDYRSTEGQPKNDMNTNGSDLQMQITTIENITEVNDNLDFVTSIIGTQLPLVSDHQHGHATHSPNDIASCSEIDTLFENDSSLDRFLNSLPPQDQHGFDPSTLHPPNINHDAHSVDNMQNISQQQWELASYPDLSNIINEASIRYQ